MFELTRNPLWATCKRYSWSSSIVNSEVIITSPTIRRINQDYSMINRKFKSWIDRKVENKNCDLRTFLPQYLWTKKKKKLKCFPTEYIPFYKNRKPAFPYFSAQQPPQAKPKINFKKCGCMGFLRWNTNKVGQIFNTPANQRIFRYYG